MMRNPCIPCIIVVVMITYSLACSGQVKTAVKDHPNPTVFFNQKVIDGLYSQTDFDDPSAVFLIVFAALDEEVTVYPTENYYYFQCYSHGSTYWGNLRLDAKDRDQGIIHLGYFRYDENGTRQDRGGNEKAFSAADSVIVNLTHPLIYSVSYRGKTVNFRLNDISNERPLNSSLSTNERFVGPIFDESGLKFFLIFNSKEKHFFYILNEAGGVPEYFIDMGDQVIEGTRTGFMFYQDTLFSRKILLAVNGRSTDRNSWYDGPFDQLPDNCVEFTNIQQYMEEVYPYTRGNVDKFGGFKNQAGARVVIFPYSIYYKEEEITELVKSAMAQELTPEEFFVRITPDPYEKMGGE
jgi:hypothetical protein